MLYCTSVRGEIREWVNIVFESVSMQRSSSVSSEGGVPKPTQAFAFSFLFDSFGADARGGGDGRREARALSHSPLSQTPFSTKMFLFLRFGPARAGCGGAGSHVTCEPPHSHIRFLLPYCTGRNRAPPLSLSLCSTSKATSWRICGPHAPHAPQEPLYFRAASRAESTPCFSHSRSYQRW
jgi:hypothetical protein